MKHTFKITLILIALFFAAQIVGLFTVSKYIQVETLPDGTIEVVHEETVVGEPPEMSYDEKSFNFIPIMVAILVGTALLLILIRFKLQKIWKLWFFIAIAITLSISFDVYIARWLALALGVILAGIRIFKPNLIVHNFTEIFIYTGITILLLPWLNLTAGIFLLVFISIYDMIAVWKSKHMIKLANFQLGSKLFAGLLMNYKIKKPSKKAGGKGELHQEKAGNAILGGGDIAFPMLFAAAVMEHLIIVQNIPKMQAFMFSLLVPLGAGIALSLLLFYSKKETFYPAMPFISVGCIAGYLVTLII